MGKITMNGKDISSAQKIRATDTKLLTRITSNGKVLNLPITYVAQMSGLIQDTKVRLWNTFNDNTNHNSDAEYFWNHPTDGRGFQTLGRQAPNGNNQLSQWDTPLIIRDIAKYDKVEITYIQMAKWNGAGTNTANIAGSQKLYQDILNDIRADHTDTSFTDKGEWQTRKDNMIITIEDIGKPTQKVTIANANHSVTGTHLYNKLEMNVAYTHAGGAQQKVQLVMGTGETSGVNSFVANIGTTGSDFSNFYSDAIPTSLVKSTDWVMVAIPWYFDDGGKQGCGVAIQDMKVKLTVK